MEFDGVRACAALQFLTGSSDSSVVASKSNMMRATTRSYLVVYSIWEFACRMRNLCCSSEDGTVHFLKTRHELLQPLRYALVFRRVERGSPCLCLLQSHRRSRRRATRAVRPRLCLGAQ